MWYKGIDNLKLYKWTGKSVVQSVEYQGYNFLFFAADYT